MQQAIERLSFLQADPIRCPARAQDLILRHRVKDYRSGELEERYADLKLEECFLFAYGFAPREIWDLIYPSTSTPLTTEEQKIIEAIKRFGTADSRRLESQLGTKSVTNYWGGTSRAAKMALDSLHDRGHLRVSHREKGIRFYEIADTPTSRRSKTERFKELLLVALRAIGPTTRRFLLSELRHFKFLVNRPKDRQACLQDLIESGKVCIDLIDTVEYISAAALKTSRIALDRVRILAPFDPIVRDRNRFEHLWGWTYRFEAYVPPAKRKLGYYAMPVLWQDSIVGWANATVAHSKLSVKIGFIQKKPREAAYRDAAEKEVAQLTAFLGLDAAAYELS